MKVQYAPKFLKKLKQLDVRIRKSFKEQLTIFIKDPFYAQLGNHELRDPYEGCRSIDITANYRAIYKEIVEEEELIAYFIEIGTHPELYEKINLSL